MSTPKASILIVEDDPHLLELLLETFEDVGYFVRGASGPEQALKLSKKHNFDLVVSDVRMAGQTDGIGLLGALKHVNPAMKTIVITGYASEEAPGRAIKIQVDDYIYKPFRLPAMLETIRRVLRSDAERQGYLSQLSSMLTAVPKKLMQMAEESIASGLRAALETERSKTLRGYYLGIRSHHLTRGAALEMWDLLEELEIRFAQAEEGQGGADFLKNLGRNYRETYEKIVNRARAGSVGNFDKREANQLSRGCFYQLYDEVKAGSLTQEQLRIAFRLRPLGPLRRASQRRT